RVNALQLLARIKDIWSDKEQRSLRKKLFVSCPLQTEWMTVLGHPRWSVLVRSSFRTLAAELPTLSTARFNSPCVTPKCFMQYLTSFSFVIVILLRLGVTLVLRRLRTRFSQLRVNSIGPPPQPEHPPCSTRRAEVAVVSSQPMSAFGRKADIGRKRLNVR